ncbi:alkyl sulfatase dimerization domain-containing protein [Pelagibius sp. Alg239-R121]|uniref:alkyl sulfatase dimerization domain-containing protein n=1 Tax=Pelagibius sp. Alg239-R121 TaxID=2993448 RepID=UPI0024A733A8|nr:alkyl sulfatase dimerization domain-containing protein [Pelagibius sp. Alg239-R121]
MAKDPISPKFLAPCCLLVTLFLLSLPPSAKAADVDETGLWFGKDPGISILERSGRNLAYTESSPKIHPRLSEHSRKMDEAMVKMGDRAYMAYGYDLTNTLMVVGDDGIIIVDPPLTAESGATILQAFRRITDLPVRAVIYTHNHIDHVAGVKAFASAEDVAAGRVDIYAHETLLNRVVNWASNLGPILGRRSSFTGASYLEHGENGSVNDGIGPRALVGSVTFIPPTITFTDTLDVEIAGVKVQLKFVPSETPDEIVAWFPDLELLQSAEVLQGESFPNLHTIRGTKFRDPVRWYKSIDILREFPARYMAPSHGRAVVGYDDIQSVLTAYRDAIQFVHDQTIRYMNLGMTPDELVEVVTLPDHLASHPWLGEFYGTVAHAVRQIYVGYLGFFEADPWQLQPLPRMERAAAYVDLMGGRDKLFSTAENAVADGKFSWAAELLTYVIRVEPDDTEARNLKANAYRLWAAEQTSINWRNWMLTAAAELDGEVLEGGLAFTSPDVIQSFPAGKIIEMMTTRLDAAKAAGTELTLGIRLTDTDEDHGLEIRRGIVQYHEKLPPEPDLTIISTKDYMNRILIGNVTIVGEGDPVHADTPYTPLTGLLAGIDNGDVKVEGGTRDDVRAFFSYFDPPTNPNGINLTVR